LCAKRISHSGKREKKASEYKKQKCRKRARLSQSRCRTPKHHTVFPSWQKFDGLNRNEQRKWPHQRRKISACDLQDSSLAL
jgi:hypothetical protein